MTACIIVERGWRTKHFGIRTVISYFISNLKARFGCEVKLIELSAGDVGFSSDEELADIYSSDINLISCPWIVSSLGTSIPNSIGIVIDIAPILAHFGVLDIKCSSSIFPFHMQHVTGYSYYNKNCSSLLFISEESRWQYYWLFGHDLPENDVLIPFDFFAVGNVEERNYDIGLVNVFDERKNFSSVIQSIRKLAISNISVIVAGEIRIPAVEEQLANLPQGVTVTRSFESVERIMKKSKVLLFPTHYEGLGLPILEAQQHGTPVISGRCGYIDDLNMCSELVVDPNDVAQIAVVLNGAIREHRRLSERVQEGFLQFCTKMTDKQGRVWEKILDCR
ncbi:glycosyltransferase family 4 protein [Agrobacterium salinitolerans]|uniref:glycosyltransferase family 4 protein n=1 Tax=Agrobacterium salinitolerans TaxID=1183413 RepID=UPI0017488E78